MQHVPPRDGYGTGAPGRGRAGHRRSHLQPSLPMPRWLTALAAAGRRQQVTRPDVVRFGLAVLVGLLGLGLAAGAALADAYLHRGVETGAAAPYVLHTAGRGLGTNVDLTAFPAGDVEGVVQALHANGFRYVRQSFSWADIEPEPGRLQWEKYDGIVDALVERGIQPVAVIHRVPSWARANPAVATPDAPPADVEVYAAFVAQFADRYAGRVPFVQLWDLPNRPEQWGGEGATPEQFLGLLGPASNEVRRVAPDMRVLLPELDPHPPQGFDDIAFLRQLYRLRADPFFDMVAARVDGGARSPLDRRIHPGGTGLSRVILIREVMIQAGDEEAAIWATRYGWPAGTDGVDASDQAEFTVRGLERARAEWPWLGPVFAWALLPSAPEAANGYALLTPAGSPTALFTALGGYASADATIATTGYTPMNAQSLTFRGTWAEQDLPPWTFKATTEQGAMVTLRFRGTGLLAYLRRGPNAGSVDLRVDGAPVAGWGDDVMQSYQASNVWLPLVDGLDDKTHEVTMTLSEPGELTIGGVVVTRDVPFMWPVVLLSAGGALLLFLALREILYLFAARCGYLQRQRAADLWQATPQMTSWNPGRRA